MKDMKIIYQSLMNKKLGSKDKTKEQIKAMELAKNSKNMT